MSRKLPRVGECFAFPLETPQARRDVLVGGLLLFALLIGWILNLGHRLEVVRRVFHDDEPYHRGFAPWRRTFVRGLGAFFAIGCYLSPSVVTGALSVLAFRAGLGLLAVLLAVVAVSAFVLAIYTLPGGMTYNAAFGDLSYLYRPDKAFRRAVAGGRAYVHAWGIAITAMLLSLLGLLALGVGFFFTSVWAWSVVGYAFSRALSLSEADSRR
jgi:hypothetical protein